MNKKQIVLNNGVKLLMINTNKFKTVTTTLYFEDELNEFNVTCDNLLFKLLATETGKHPSRKEFRSYLKELYDMKVSSSKETMGEVFSFSILVDTLNNKYTLNNENLVEKQFEVLREILYTPFIKDNKFDVDYFNQIKNEYMMGLLNEENYKEVIVGDKVAEIFGKNNKSFIKASGYIKELNKIENSDVYSKYLKLNSMCKMIAVCGEIDFDEIENYVNKYLKFEGNRNNYSYLYKNNFKKYGDYSYDSKFNQSSIAVLYDLAVYAGDRLYYPAIIFSDIFNYHLFKIVREEHNFCYSIYNTYYSSRGLCYLQSNIEEKNYEMTLKLIDEILEGMKKNIDEKVFNISMDKVINAFRKEVDSPTKIITKEHQRDVYKLNGLEETIQMLSKVSISEVKEVANMIEKKFSVILKEAK